MTELWVESEPCFHWIVKSYASDYNSDSITSENQPKNLPKIIGLITHNTKLAQM